MKNCWPGLGTYAVAKKYFGEKYLIYMRQVLIMNQRLDGFLGMTGKDILSYAGKISHDRAVQKANQEYLTYKEKTKNKPSQVEKDFVKYIDTVAKALKDKK